jgi:hypothetical protein
VNHFPGYTKDFVGVGDKVYLLNEKENELKFVGIYKSINARNGNATVQTDEGILIETKRYALWRRKPTRVVGDGF